MTHSELKVEALIEIVNILIDLHPTANVRSGLQTRLQGAIQTREKDGKNLLAHLDAMQEVAAALGIIVKRP
jgi:hypothetical protein